MFFPQISLASISFSRARWLWGVLLLGAWGTMLAGAAPVQDRVIVDFPVKSNTQGAEWMSGPVAEWEEYGRRSIHIPVQPLAGFQRLVATLIFAEGADRTAHVWWESDQPSAPVPLGGNLVEGWEGWNQRSLVLPPELAAQGGMLVIMTGGSERTLFRLVLNLLEEGSVFTSGARVGDELHEFDSFLLPAHELQGAAWQMPGDAWRGNLIDAHLQEQAESLQGGVEFGVEIRPAPRRAVLRFSFHGSFGVRPSVWINGQLVEGVSLEVPPLHSPAYLEPGPGAEPLYAGWREGWVVVPHGLLVVGDNSILFSTGEESGFLHHARLEMWFAAPLLPPAAPAGDFEDITSDLTSESLPSPSSGTPLEPALPAWEPSDPTTPPSTDALPDPGSLFRTTLF
jgi:hypothetical protein